MINNIPSINIPTIAYNNGIKIIPKAIINHYNDFFKKIKKDLEIDENIEIQNHRSIEHFKYYYEIANDIQAKFYDSINTDSFWKSIMNYKICQHRFKKGNKAGDLCGRSFDIKTHNKYGQFLCSDHIPKKYYNVKPLNVPIENRCIGNTVNNERCKFNKKYNDICSFHYAEKYSINLNTVDDHYILHEEINLLYNIYVENTNNSLLKNYNYNCKINKKLIIIDKYEKLNHNNKLISFYNEKEKTMSSLEEDILNNLEITKNGKNFENLIQINNIQAITSYDLNEEKNKLNQLNIDINNFRYKLEIINEILKINPKCNIKDCTNINNLNIIKGLYCQTHANDAINTYNKNNYKFNDWNYI
jgi:hypothetical protein